MAAIKNCYDLIKKEAPSLLAKSENSNKHLHGLDLPFRMIIVAPSGSGKTNFLCNLIMLMCAGKGTFQKVNIITRDKDEALYNWMAGKSNSIEISEGLSSIPKLDVATYPKGSQSLLVLDDLVLSKNLSAVEEVYIRGRKLGVSVIFISQSYFKIPGVIRQNCSYIVILKLSQSRDAKLILSEMGLGITREQLWSVYEYATDTKFSPLIIDLAAPKSERFRKGFDEVVRVE
jgi:hypothetical protein